MYDFSIRELNLIGMALLLMGSQVDGDNNAPEELLPIIEGIYNKMRDVMELRCAEQEQFDSIAKQLPELITISKEVINEMENNK